MDLNNGRGFIEAALYHHKTAFKRRTKVIQLLPVAGVIPGLSGYDWATCWLQKRLDMGLQASMQQPTMPAPVATGGWSNHPLSSSEASIWLREILQPWSVGSVKNVATHSSKATILSWMSKSNVEISLRRLAGYHVSPGDKSALEYSRDDAAPVLRQIEALFIAVRANVFNPDASRANRWHGAQSLEEAVKVAATHGMSSDSAGFGVLPFNSFLMSLEPSDELQSSADCHEGLDPSTSTGFEDDMTLEITLKRCAQVESNHTIDGVSDMSESSLSDNSSLDRDSDSEDIDRKAELDGEYNSSDLVAPSDLSGKRCFRHNKSKKLHFVDKTLYGVHYFKCGRKCNENYERLLTVPAFSLHGCMTCFGWSDRPE